MPTSISLTVFGKKLQITDGKVTSEFDRELCPFCGSAVCLYTCPASKACRDTPMAEPDAVVSRLQYNLIVSLLENIAASHAKRGVNIKNPAYALGLEEAVQSYADLLERQHEISSNQIQF